jgi:RimJ/RimL family protein N-acetyltransferase
VALKVAEFLSTERLSLRPFAIEDWPQMHGYYSDIECTRYTTGRALTEGESWRSMAAMIGHWSIHGYGPYALEEKASGRVVGVSGFWYPGDWPEPEIKWGLLPEFWRQGYARDAAMAVLAHGKKMLPDIRFISLIHQQNDNSANLARALGANLEKQLDFRQQRFNVFRHQ